MIAFGQANILDLRAGLHDRGGAFDFEILDHLHRVTVLEFVAEGVLLDSRFIEGRDRTAAPLMVTFRADELAAVVVGLFVAALGARRHVIHGWFSSIAWASRRRLARTDCHCKKKKSTGTETKMSGHLKERFDAVSVSDPLDGSGQLR